MEKKLGSSTNDGLAKTQEIAVTIHYADSGPSLESCMISILSNHLSKNADS